MDWAVEDDALRRCEEWWHKMRLYSRMASACLRALSRSKICCWTTLQQNTKETQQGRAKKWFSWKLRRFSNDETASNILH